MRTARRRPVRVWPSWQRLLLRSGRLVQSAPHMRALPVSSVWKEHGQGRILALLSERESMTQKELQEMLRIQPGSGKFGRINHDAADACYEADYYGMTMGPAIGSINNLGLWI